MQINTNKPCTKKQRPKCTQCEKFGHDTEQCYSNKTRGERVIKEPDPKIHMTNIEAVNIEAVQKIERKKIVQERKVENQECKFDNNILYYIRKPGS